MDGDWPHKLLALQEALHWAARGRATVVFRDANAASSARQSRRPWIEIAVDSISMIGQDNVSRVDDGAGGQTEVYEGQREFSVDVRAYSREQTPGQQAWYIADLARTRLRRSKYARERWLDPHDLAIVDMREVVNLSPRVWDGRAEGEASLEMRLATNVCETDEANATTWIETVLLSSDLGIDPSLELADDQIPPP